MDIQNYWNKAKIYESNVNNKEKYLSTTCYPYQNGIFHLGHTYTILKSEFMARYQRLLNKNVLFPFGFHCTGMPITGLVNKIKNNDKKQINTMKLFGINDCTEFKNEEYWIKYFPQQNINSLKKLGLCIDFRRSFITRNSFYDSFVKWQFTKFDVSLEEKYVIYSELDKQPCGPHDRLIGEEVKPKRIKLYICKGKKMWLMSDLDDKYYEYMTDHDILPKKIMCQKIIANNLSSQNYVIKQINDKPFYRPYNFTIINNISCHIPDGYVVSISGCECTVSLQKQWFINYNKLKQLTYQFLNDITTDVKNELENTLDKLDKWGCSRSIGLGTKLPFDDKYVIGSLSDSTIYPAFYTISHLLFPNTLDGSDGVIDPNEMTYDVWDYIFCNGNLPKFSDMELLNKMKKEFNYWYPVDMRSSGKDLLRNHLVMYLYNHICVFDKQYWPKGISVNGFINVNGKKMSKSGGNFITLNEVLNKYDPDVVRFLMASFEKGLCDHDFDFKMCDKIKKLLNEYIEFTLNINKYKFGKTNELFDDILINNFNKVIKLVKSFYEKMEYSNVIKFAWYELNKSFNDYKYRSCNNINKILFIKLIKKQLIMLCPIIPHTCEYLWIKFGMKGFIVNQLYPSHDPYNKTLVWSEQYYKKIIHDFKKKYKKQKNITNGVITVCNSLSPLQKKVVDSLKDLHLKKINIHTNIAHKLKPYFTNDEWKNKVMKIYRYVLKTFNKRKKFSYDLLINEKQILLKNKEYIKNILSLDQLDIVSGNSFPEEPIIKFS